MLRHEAEVQRAVPCFRTPCFVPGQGTRGHHCGMEFVPVLGMESHTSHARTGLMLDCCDLPSPSMEAVEDKFLYDLLTETKGSFCVPLLFYLLISFYSTEPPSLTHPILNKCFTTEFYPHSSLRCCESDFHSVAQTEFAILQSQPPKLPAGS